MSCTWQTSVGERCSPLRSIFVSLTFSIGVVLLRQYRIILSADTASEVRQLLGQKAQIILDAAKVSAASGGNSEPKQGQRSQSARGFCPRSTMRVPQPDIIEHFGNADAVPQPPGRCLSRQAGIVRCCLTKISPCSPRTALTKPPAWRIVKDRICKLYAHCPALCNNAVRVPPAAPA